MYIYKIVFTSFVLAGFVSSKEVTSYPASGYRNHTSGAFTNTGSGIWCWSSAVSAANAYLLYFNSTNVYPATADPRARGYVVRCVQHLRLSFEY